MKFEFDFNYATAVLLVAGRLAALLLFSPLFVSARIPGQVRLLFVLALAAVLVASLQVMPAQIPHTLGELGAAFVYEVFIGALMAFGLFAAFGAFLFGGRILDFQMGFGVASVIDPSTNDQGPLIGTALNMMAVMTFLLLDGHHLVLRGVAYSLERIPPGSTLAELDMAAIVAQFGLMFVFGLAVVAPAVFTLLLLDVGMAVAARTMPQVNMFIVSLPLKIFVGLSVLALSLPVFAPLLERVYQSIFRYWQQVLV